MAFPANRRLKALQPVCDFVLATKGTLQHRSSSELARTSLLARALFKIVERQMAKFTNKGVVDYDSPQFKR